MLESLARAVSERRLGGPAVFLLESAKPLSFVGSQFMHALSPMVSVLFGGNQWDTLAEALEDRETVETLIVRIEELDRTGARAGQTGQGGDDPSSPN